MRWRVACISGVLVSGSVGYIGMLDLHVGEDREPDRGLEMKLEKGAEAREWIILAVLTNNGAGLTENGAARNGAKLAGNEADRCGSHG